MDIIKPGDKVVVKLTKNDTNFTLASYIYAGPHPTLEGRHIVVLPSNGATSTVAEVKRVPTKVVRYQNIYKGKNDNFWAGELYESEEEAKRLSRQDKPSPVYVTTVKVKWEM